MGFSPAAVQTTQDLLFFLYLFRNYIINIDLFSSSIFENPQPLQPFFCFSQFSAWKPFHVGSNISGLCFHSACFTPVEKGLFFRLF